MHQRAFFEVKQRRTRVTVALILLDGMPPSLMRTGVLQLDGGHRQAVDCQHDVRGGVVTGVARHLPRHGELVLRIQRQHIGRQRVRRFEVSQPEQLAVELEAVAQHMQAALNVQLLAQRIDQHGLQIAAVLRGHLGPQLGLGGLDESEYPRGEQGPHLVPLGIGAGQPAAIGEHLFEIGFERFFGGLCHAQAPGCAASRNSTAWLYCKTHPDAW